MSAIIVFIDCFCLLSEVKLVCKILTKQKTREEGGDLLMSLKIRHSFTLYDTLDKVKVGSAHDSGL